MSNVEVISEIMQPWMQLPAGDYAIVELFGHTTLIGRVEEVERFGTKMLQIECLFAGRLLDPVYHGGAAIYRFTPCSAKVAWEKGPKDGFHLPPAIRATVPELALTAGSHASTDDDDSY